MKTAIKKYFSMIMILSMILATNVTAFAAETVSDSSVNTVAEDTSSVARASTLHKINGVYSDGESMSYETTTRTQCYEIRVKGTTYDASTKYVDVVVTTKKDVVVATLYGVALDNKEHTMILWPTYNSTGFAAGTYTVTVTSRDTKAYDVSTYIYY